ncbi:bis(5'-nucleosyl)-tetraphosphatase (symmetrical) YqeK [Anaerococcus sp. Marseille-Q5996]|uniref:bis(5'-nucleosyl)-tetraphosphatase (symmetrical) YqeK n=1 Tax=Anaerococcus sp. Marseille-Q5996 TaxID=2972769 RepID=UPI0021C7256C|nr:bis(5'-nucleosyl)-tetraphosphatase (symmetrical) YqeK [Anaerococcus sp. Marseille-Q5996]
MFNLDLWEDKLLSDIGEKRYKHCIRVMETALELNNNIDIDKVKSAAILHDCAKYNEEKYLKLYGESIENYQLQYKAVLHSFLGAEVAKKEYNINDTEVLDAIRYHTTAKADMSDLEKIIYLADAIEPKRDYPGVNQLRKLSKENLNEAIIFSLNHNINFIIEKNDLIHPLTIEARNFLIKEKNE